jgi:ATP-binding cassette subfamily C protein LapB
VALDHLLAMPTEHPDGTTPIRVSKIMPQIKLESVTFKHRGARDGIDIPALNIPAGARVGLIGPVGSGKSTLMRIMAGLYRAQSGLVLINGVDIGQIAEADLRSQCCSIPQEYSLISGTLRENIVLGLPDPGDEAIMAVAAETGLATVIQNHPSGLNLPIMEGGRGLSGGQRTLVGLTRAILAKPRLLLLDEPTANLDQETEMRVLSALFRAVGTEGTIIMTTHKLQLLRFVNEVLVMTGGKIALNGPTNAVLEKLRPPPAGQTSPVAAPAPSAPTKRAS